MYLFLLLLRHRQTVKATRHPRLPSRKGKESTTAPSIHTYKRQRREGDLQNEKIYLSEFRAYTRGNAKCTEQYFRRTINHECSIVVVNSNSISSTYNDPPRGNVLRRRLAGGVSGRVDHISGHSQRCYTRMVWYLPRRTPQLRTTPNNLVIVPAVYVEQSAVCLLANPLRGGKQRQEAVIRLLRLRFRRWKAGETRDLWKDLTKMKTRKKLTQKEPLGEHEAIANEAIKIKRLVNKGLISKACRQLCSKGIRECTSKQAAKIQQLFPPRRSQITKTGR